MKTGVYAIVNVLNGHTYIGSASLSFAKRFRNHKHDLCRGNHHSLHLQRAWNKYGENAFLFVPVEFTAPDDAVRIEQTYIDRWKPVYNVAPIAGSARGVKHTEASKARMKAGAALANARPEVKARRSQAQKELWARPDFKARKAAGQNRPDVRRRKSEKTVASWSDPVVAARRMNGIKTAHALPEVKAKKSASTKKKWQDPDYRERWREHTKSRWSNPDYRARMCSMSKEMHQRPGDKERRGASISAALRARSPITPEIATSIQQALTDGETGSSLAKKYGVTGALISTIKLGTHWACNP